MNLEQIAGRIERKSRLTAPDSHRRQEIYSIVNEAIDEILSWSDSWSFLFSTAELLSTSGENSYALPSDYDSMINVSYDGDPLKVFYPGNALRYDHLTSPGACAVFQLSNSPYAKSGYVYPTYGSKTVVGKATAFSQNLTGRFFMSNMDGTLYKIEDVEDSETLILEQEFTGSCQAGRVSVFGDTDDEKKVVYGNVHQTNFSEDMQGRRIQIEGNGDSTFLIESVDEYEQKLTIDSPSNTGEGLIYSVQDYYQIDPPGKSIMRIYDTPDEDDKVIAVNYYAFQTPLTGPQDIPALPPRWHYLIVHTASEMYLSEIGGSRSQITLHNRKKNEGIANLLNNEDTTAQAVHDMVEPDIVRHKTSNKER